MELQEHRRCSQLRCGSTYYKCNLQYFKPSRRRAEQAALLCRPVFADLADLPPVMLVIGTEDILLDDNLVLATRLAAAGVEVDLRVYPASPHAFSGHATSMARVALDDIDQCLRDRLGVLD
ncbi:alpha/beta hydrolase [Williamsia muralis]|uniref:alpha/beta hydrolase n=1 Tax=Williamsia marianensis TaxID=85044 RepID=UPI0038164B90